MLTKKFLLLLIIVGLIYSECTGQKKVKYDTDTVSSIRGQFIPLPAIYFTPETKLAIGCIGVYLFKTAKDTRTSNIDFVAIYTQNRQIVIDPIYNIFTPHEKYFIKGSVVFTRFPEFFYGIGNETPQDTKENLSYKTFRIYNRVLRQIYPHLFVGLQHQYFKTYDIKFPLNTSYPPGAIPGDRGSITSGLGAALVYDARDNILNATSGFYAEISSIIYRNVFQSQFEFTSLTVDVRSFSRVGVNSVLALQGLVNINSGNVPFKQQATIGGFSMMRGFYNGRFRDKKLLATQLEFRQHVYKRLGAVAFASCGEVSPTMNGFNVNDVKIAGGGGLRFLLSRKEKINIRFDVGFGRNTHGFYVNISEAF